MDERWTSGGSAPEAARADHGHEELERLVRYVTAGLLLCVVIQAACIVFLVVMLLLLA